MATWPIIVKLLFVHICRSRSEIRSIDSSWYVAKKTFLMASMAFILAKSCRYSKLHSQKHIDLKSLERCKFAEVEKIKMGNTYRWIHMHLLPKYVLWIYRQRFLNPNPKFFTLFYPKWSTVHTAMVVILIGKILSVSMIKSWGGWKTLFHLVGGSKPTGCDWTKTPILHVNDGEKCGVILIESTNPLLFLRLKVKALLEKKLLSENLISKAIRKNCSGMHLRNVYLELTFQWAWSSA